MIVWEAGMPKTVVRVKVAKYQKILTTKTRTYIRLMSCWATSNWGDVYIKCFELDLA